MGGVDILSRAGKASFDVAGRVASISIYQVSIITGLGCIQLFVPALDDTCIVAEGVPCLTYHALRIIRRIAGVAVGYLARLKHTKEGSGIYDIPRCACGAIAAGGTCETVRHGAAASRTVLVGCI
jgi:hypothetical protein